MGGEKAGKGAGRICSFKYLALHLTLVKVKLERKDNTSGLPTFSWKPIPQNKDFPSLMRAHLQELESHLAFAFFILVSPKDIFVLHHNLFELHFLPMWKPAYTLHVLITGKTDPNQSPIFI
ncbi:hypothetical protein Y1Q_0001406 [Alligator mississippiensis]|uniref:Uncharacterized protein n=1 Tax=Alligator mississippiensis TaxID=8496 RepID=A0A151M9A7_ALLMI|nr:hypothetical protein Y1Q_0001406 [Alligator mississippiensis]